MINKRMLFQTTFPAIVWALLTISVITTVNRIYLGINSLFSVIIGIGAGLLYEKIFPKQIIKLFRNIREKIYLFFFLNLVLGEFGLYLLWREIKYSNNTIVIIMGIFFLYGLLGIISFRSLGNKKW